MGASDLLPEFEEVRRRYVEWSYRYIQAEEDANPTTKPLYHYTNCQALRGILQRGKFWFTDYRHLNDPSELTYGIDIAHDVACGIATGADQSICDFVDVFCEQFRHANFASTLEFFIASFSRARDDLGQWRAYGDNGRGVAIGFSHSVFTIEDKLPLEPLPVVVGPVRYEPGEICGRHKACIEEAAAIVLSIAQNRRDLLSNPTNRRPFMERLVQEMAARPLIWNCLTSKHLAYQHEQEVRLVIMGERDQLAPDVLTRCRGSEIVPYIAKLMPVRDPHKIAEIVVGPAAPPDTERTLRTMLRSIGITEDFPISRSDIPYRAS